MSMFVPERPTYTADEIMKRLRKTIADGRPVVAAGASAGIIAKCAEIGGADLLIVYSTGRSRMMGLPTWELGHSNPVTLGMYDEIANVADEVPIVGGAEAQDPTSRRLSRLIDDFQSTGFDGIINFPTYGMQDLEDRSGVDLRGHEDRSSVGLGFGREVELIRLTAERGMFTVAYVHTRAQAQAMAAAGVHVQVPHAGWTTGGIAGAGTSTALTLEQACETVQDLAEVTWQENPDAIVIGHGGPLAAPEDTMYLYEHTDLQGFLGASSIERIPVEQAIVGITRAFKDQHLRSHAAQSGEAK
jgi:predicted TIM-barrel enzyme